MAEHSLTKKRRGPVGCPDVCPVCRTEFKRKYSRGGIRKLHCSKRCAYQAAYVDKQCVTCGKSFRTNNKGNGRHKIYCSLACFSRYPCQVCGKTIMGRVAFQGGTKRFCTRRCASIANNTLKGQANYAVRGYAATLRRLGQLACERCGLQTVEYLVVHHLDRNRRNNEDDNLQTLCANCHHAEHWGDSAHRERLLSIARFLAGLK